MGRWGGGSPQWGALFSVPSSSLIVKFSPSLRSLFLFLYFSLSACFLILSVFISEPLISLASPTNEKEEEDKSVLLWVFFPAVIKNIKHLKTATLTCSCPFLCVPLLLVYSVCKLKQLPTLDFCLLFLSLFFFLSLPGVLNKNDCAKLGVSFALAWF